MPLLLWNPSAISYLAQFVLALAISLYFLRRILAMRKQEIATPAMGWLLVIVGAFTLLAVTNLFRSALSQGMQPMILPLPAPVAAVSICAFVQFAYGFPTRLPVQRAERIAAAVLSLAFLGGETGFAVWRYVALSQGSMVFRPASLDICIMLMVIWVAVLFLRQWLHATKTSPRTQRSGEKLVSLWRQLAVPAGPDAASARAFLVFMALPLANVVVMLLRAEGITGPTVTDILNSWLSLAQLAVFALLFLNHLPERSSFLIKLSGVSMTLILAVIVAVSWLMGPVYAGAFRPDNRVMAQQTYRFTPDGQGGYTAGPVAFHAESDLGAPVNLDTGRVDLPFLFTFYGHAHQRLYVREDGFAGFNAWPGWADSLYDYPAQPLINIMAVELGGFRHERLPEGSGVFARSDAEHAVITWRRLAETDNPSSRYSFQLLLHKDGTIDMSYLELPSRFDFDLFTTNKTATRIGILPGAGATPVQRVSLGSGAVVHGAPGAGLLDDYFLEFQRYIDRAYAPVAALMVVASILLLVALPAFLYVNLSRPLTNLLRGVDAFRRGQPLAKVPVTYHDEIGFLTDSFNAMADAQHHLVATLEERVAERTRQIADITARNARLEERVRLSSDLHDTVSQTLFSSAVLADSLQDAAARPAMSQSLQKLGALNRHALTEMRDLLSELRTDEAADLPLGMKLTALCRKFEADHGIAVEVEITGDTVISADVRSTFFRVAQESFNNIAKHAQARTVRVAFEALPGQALLTIADDGRGFEPDKVGTAHLGLQIMRERAVKINAVLEIDSGPDVGTTVTLVWLGDYVEPTDPNSSGR